MNLFMSKRRKPSHKDKMLKRQWAQAQMPPPREAVASYINTFEAAALAPDVYAEIAKNSDEEIDQLAMGIAFPEKFGLPADGEQVLGIAEVIKDWHILNGVLKLYDWWPTPPSAMTPQQIIEQIRKDRHDGRFEELDALPEYSNE